MRIYKVNNKLMSKLILINVQIIEIKYIVLLVDLPF